MNNDTKQIQLEIEELETKIQGMVSERQYISNKIEEAQSKLKLLKIGSETFYYLNIFGEIAKVETDSYNEDVIKQMQEQGNTFKTRDEAEKERDRRALLYEFNQFKNERNNGWSPNWKDSDDLKFYIAFGKKGYLEQRYASTLEIFATFGYFRDCADCLDAINKFGDRIKKLYID